MTTNERYDYAFDPDSQAWAARLLRQVPHGVSVLELGPGPGAMTRVLADRGYAVTVVENDPESIEALRAMKVDVIDGDLNTLDWVDRLGDRRFEVILACDVLEHLQAPAQTLSALRELAAPAARLVVSMPNVAYAGLLAALRMGQFEYADKGLLDRTHLRFFTRSSLTRMLMETGWAPEHWEGNRVPLEHSEFVWSWQQLDGAQRQALMAGWEDGEVYQWMALATPMADEATARIRAANRQAVELQERLQALTLRYEAEHGSLVEHQKAFTEAKAAILHLENELTHKTTAAEAAQQVAVAEREQRQRLAGQLVAAEQLVEGLRAQGWPGRLRRLMDALRR